MSAEATNAIDHHSQEVAAFDARYRNQRDFKERYELWRRLIIKYSSKESQVLDVGCGPGVFSFEAARHNKSVLGVDGSGEMVELCRRKQATRADGSIRFLQSTIEELPRLGLRGADLILCSSVLEYVEDLNACAAILRGLLTPNGHLIVSLPNRASLYRRLEKIAFRTLGKPRYFRFVKHLPTLPEFNRLMLGLGLEVIETHYFANWSPVPSRWTGVAPDWAMHNLFLGVYRTQTADVQQFAL